MPSIERFSAFFLAPVYLTGGGSDPGARLAARRTDVHSGRSGQEAKRARAGPATFDVKKKGTAASRSVFHQKTFSMQFFLFPSLFPRAPAPLSARLASLCRLRARASTRSCSLTGRRRAAGGAAVRRSAKRTLFTAVSHTRLLALRVPPLPRVRRRWVLRRTPSSEQTSPSLSPPPSRSLCGGGRRPCHCAFSSGRR